MHILFVWFFHSNRWGILSVFIPWNLSPKLLYLVSVHSASLWWLLYSFSHVSSISIYPCSLFWFWGFNLSTSTLSFFIGVITSQIWCELGRGFDNILETQEHQNTRDIQKMSPLSLLTSLILPPATLLHMQNAFIWTLVIMNITVVIGIEFMDDWRFMAHFGWHYSKVYWSPLFSHK